MDDGSVQTVDGCVAWCTWAALPGEVGKERVLEVDCIAGNTTVVSRGSRQGIVCICERESVRWMSLRGGSENRHRHLGSGLVSSLPKLRRHHIRSAVDQPG